MEHRLGLITRTQISVCKSPFSSAGTAVSLFRRCGASRGLSAAAELVCRRYFGTCFFLNNLFIVSDAKRAKFYVVVD